MEHLGGSEIQVVLSLKEGRGFNRISNPTSIVATLNGQTLETGCIEPDPQPRYTTDLVWKTDKNVLRKMRSAQEPVKIECFEIRENGTRDKIGHILLSLRSARIMLPRDGDVAVPVNWHAFFNLRSDVKPHKPQVSLALTIEEHDAYVRRITRKEPPESSRNKCGPSDAPPVGSCRIAAPYPVEEERLIQLGPLASCRSLFELEVTAGTAQNLHLFRDESLGLEGNYSLWYRVLDNDVLLKTFESLEKRLTLDEQATIRIRSSLPVLRDYWRESRPNFLLIMQQGGAILGHHEVDLRALLPPEIATTEGPLRSDEASRLDENAITHRCVLNRETRRTRGSIGDSQDNEAFLDLQLRLSYRPASKQIDQSESPGIREEETVPRTQRRFDASSVPRAELPHGIDACDDFAKCCLASNEHGETLCRDACSRNADPQMPPSRSLGDRVRLPRSVVTVANSRNPGAKSVEAYRCYCLGVNLTGITLSSSVQNVEFRFHHPKAEIMSTLYPRMPLTANEKLRLQDIGCKLHFISASNEIRHLLLSFPPRVSVREVVDGSAKTSGQTTLDVDHLFARDKHESQYEAALYDNDKNVIGTLDVSMRLEDHGPYYESRNRSRKPDDDNLGPPIMDDGLVYKIVEELEIWKERQQEIFLVELKRKEERHLDRLSEEWQKRRENLESKLACSVEQCKILANSLNMATEDLRTRRLKSLEKEARLIKANEDLQWTYDKKLNELQEASRRVQDDLLAKVKLLQEQGDKMAADLEPLRLENDRLERLASRQAEELQALRKGTLTQDQTASLIEDVKALEQKLENTQQSKSFFKEQWGKAVREIHRMKMEHQQAIEVQIKTNKDELKNLDLEDILCADSSSLTNDQKMLGEIQKEIDVIKPRSSHRSFYAPLDPIYAHHVPAKTRRSTSARADEHDERVRKLIEERDSLLKTGSYSIDHEIIIKLNAEIRSLLDA